VTRFTVVSILPEIVDGALAVGVVGRARAAGGLPLAFINPRDFTHDRHRSVDDTPYGGGPGMVMRCEPLAAAIDAAGPGHRVFLGPGGAPLTQATVRRWRRSITSCWCAAATRASISACSTRASTRRSRSATSC
jgi:tRNA (guanine37-N1)-methyltransferase